MRRSATPRLLTLLLCTVVLAFPAAQAQPDKGASATGGDMMSMMRENNDKMMAMKPTGDPDVDFATMMRMHHMSGMQMAEHEMKNGRNDEMKKMARKIRDSQKKEVEQFDRFPGAEGPAGVEEVSARRSGRALSPTAIGKFPYRPPFF